MLGCKVSSTAIVVDATKVAVIAKLPSPNCVKAIRSFLGHARFYRRFVRDISKIVKPMNDHLAKEATFVFSDVCLSAFNLLKEHLTSAPMVVAPDGHYRLN